MLVAIRNMLFQPLTFSANGNVGGLHLCSRERAVIAEDQLSQEIKSAADRGLVSLTQIPGSTQPDPRVEMANDEHAPEDVSPAKSRKRGQ